MKKNLIYLILIIIAFTVACKKDKTDPPDNPVSQNEFELYIDFWNPEGDNPEISFDAMKTSPEIKIDFTRTFAGFAVPPHFTNVIIDNLRIINEQNINYEIQDINAYEYRQEIGGWKLDVEFTMSYEPIEDLNVMLVLDASESLGEDFPKVKEYAISFVDSIFMTVPIVKIGIVAFSDVIDVFGLSSDKYEIIDYIQNIEQGLFTSLYDAINVGIDTLQSNAAESKSLLIFTDGTDNNSDPEITYNYLLNKLENDPNVIKINSFTIGLEGKGGVDKPVLELLATNGGIAEFPQNVDQLGVVFSRFSKSISNVYNLIYTRNQQQIPKSSPAKLKFVINALPK
ncbi:MAG: VWA domain-containing protein [Bacteroidales bacterium]|nr:VWA domain-containing protein [Bacteroidales bacterium]